MARQTARDRSVKETVADSAAKRERDMKIRKRLLLGAAAATAAAAAGYYFYASKNAKQNREAISKRAMQFKDDVMEQARQLKNIDRVSIIRIIDSVTSAYESMRELDKRDVLRVAEELKDNWQKLLEELTVNGEAARKEVKRTMRENSAAVKRVARKVANKRNKEDA